MSDAARELLKEGDGASNENVIILDEFNKPSGQEIKKAISDFEEGKAIKKDKFGEKLRK